MAKAEALKQVTPEVQAIGNDHVLLRYPPSEHAPDGSNVIVPNAPIWTEVELREMAERAATRERIVNQLGSLTLKELTALERQIRETLINDGEQS